MLNMTSAECHIGNFTAEQCIEALEQIALRPYELKRQEWVNDLVATSPDANNSVSNPPNESLTDSTGGE